MFCTETAINSTGVATIIAFRMNFNFNGVTAADRLPRQTKLTFLVYY